jgi:hypothetical protein
MPRCARSDCRRYRPGVLVRLGGLGLQLDDHWYCSAQCLQVAARTRLARTPLAVPATLTTMPQVRIGGLLARMAKIPKEVLDRAVSAQAETGLRLGTQLVRHGVVSSLDVLRALATQGGVAFLTAIDAGRLTAAPGNLSADAVRRFRLVPFEVDGERQLVKVACTAPVPRTEMGALRQLTGWIIQPYLVSDEQWPSLVRAYGAARREDRPVCAPVPDVATAAARVAEVAKLSRGVRMVEVRCEDDLWVRLESAGGVEDLWLTLGDRKSAAPSDGRAENRDRPRAEVGPAGDSLPAPVAPSFAVTAAPAVAPRHRRPKRRATADAATLGRDPLAFKPRRPPKAEAPAAATARVGAAADLAADRSFVDPESLDVWERRSQTAGR